MHTSKCIYEIKYTLKFNVKTNTLKQIPKMQITSTEMVQLQQDTYSVDRGGIRYKDYKTF